MWEDGSTVFCGIDWAERHHDVTVVDDTGTLLAKARISDDAAGYSKLLDLLAEHGDSPETPIPVAIETSRGLLVAVLRSSNRKVFAINPLAASRYRDRHGVSRKKSDPGDALVLTNILRTDMHAHRQLPADSELAQAITVLARARQDAVWSRQQVANQVRSLLREYYPATLHAFQGKEGGLTRADARTVRTLAPTPAKAAKLTLAQLRAALKRSGRTRSFDTETARLRDIFRSEHARHRPAVEDAFGRLMHAGFLWAFSALTASPGANAHYRRRREHGEWHNAAQRHLLNRFLGQLHRCLQTRQPFDEQRAFAPLLPAPA
ncbi:IS110 family transposase [Streptomyces sp. NPDC006012]|uniref:IS110 family transposase n=1 Tax=Streptomyces sp. NPDC006012 TaxID=3364739 RepID=UPI0036BF84E0